jgi:hypothetical protein
VPNLMNPSLLYEVFAIVMPRKVTISSLGRICSALLMLLAILWLSVSLPFVYAAQQQVAATEKVQQTKLKQQQNPLAGTNEEKTESGVVSISEYLHDAVQLTHPIALVVKFEKCHAPSLYIAFHPELHFPPPDLSC